MENPWVNPDLYAILVLWVEREYAFIRRHVDPAKAERCYMGGGFSLFHVTDSVFAKAAIETARHVSEFSGDVDEARNSSVAISILSQLACKLVSIARDEFDLNVFDRLYADLEQYLYRWEGFAFTSTVDICNLDLRDVGRVEFADAVLRPMTAEDIDRRTPTCKSPGVSPFIEGAEPLPMAIFERHDVIGNRTQPDHKSFIIYGGDSYSFTVDAAAEKLLLALRLTAPGTVWRGPRRVLFESSLFDTFNSSNESDEGFYTRHNLAGLFSAQARQPLPAFGMTAEMLERVRRLLTLLDVHHLNERELRLPVRRFNRSYRYDNPEDRFVDLWVGLESLTGDRRPQFSQRMYKRIAVLMDADAETWNDVRAQVQASYGVRCDILHGRTATGTEIATFWDQTEAYLRRIINLVLERGRRFSDTELDELVTLFGRGTAAGA